MLPWHPGKKEKRDFVRPHFSPVHCCSLHFACSLLLPPHPPPGSVIHLPGTWGSWKHLSPQIPHSDRTQNLWGGKPANFLSGNQRCLKFCSQNMNCLLKGGAPRAPAEVHLVQRVAKCVSAEKQLRACRERLQGQAEVFRQRGVLSDTRGLPALAKEICRQNS